MYSEISIKIQDVENKLNDRKLKTFFSKGQSHDIEKIYNETIFSNDTFKANNIFFAYSRRQYHVIFLLETPNNLKIHLEGISIKNDLKKIKQWSEEFSDHFFDLVNENKLKIIEYEGIISSDESNYICSFKKVDFGFSLWQIFKNDIIEKFIIFLTIPLYTVFYSKINNVDIETAFPNLFGAIILYILLIFLYLYRSHRRKKIIFME